MFNWNVYNIFLRENIFLKSPFLSIIYIILMQHYFKNLQNKIVLFYIPNLINYHYFLFNLIYSFQKLNIRGIQQFKRKYFVYRHSWSTWIAKDFFCPSAGEYLLFNRKKNMTLFLCSHKLSSQKGKLTFGSMG